MNVDSVVFQKGRIGGDMKITQVLCCSFNKFRNKFNTLSVIFPQMIPMLNHEPGKIIDNDDPCDKSYLGQFDW